MNAIVPVPNLSEIDDFEFDFDGVRILGRIIAGDVWLIADATAKALGHRESHDMTRGLDDDEKGPQSVRTPGGFQMKTFISEAGLYKVVLQRRGSKKMPGATRHRIERFQRLVFHEILPKIRKTGSYVAPTAEPVPTAVSMLEALKDPTTVLALIEHHARETLAERAAHAVTHGLLEERTAEREVLQHRVEADRPAVLAQQRMAAGTGDLLLSDAAVTIGVDRIRLIEWLIEIGHLRRGADRRLRCTRDGRLRGWVRHSVDTDDVEAGAKSWVRVTATGFAALSEHFCRGANATSQDVIPGF